MKNQNAPWMMDESVKLWNQELLNKEIAKRKRFKLYAGMAYLFLIAFFGMIIAFVIHAKPHMGF